MKNFSTWLETHITLHTHDDAKAEKVNAYTHFLGSAIAFFALIYILLNLDHLESEALRLGMVIYGIANLLFYTASGLYHYLPRNNVKRFCRILDHSNIYFLIAGTYTPLLLYINSQKTITLAWLMLLICALGIAFTLFFWGRLKPMHVALYLLMGWMVVFCWGDIVPFLPKGLMSYIIGGGITYTLGVIFYGCKKIPHYHAIWHLFVLGGSIWFYLGFFRYFF